MRGYYETCLKKLSTDWKGKVTTYTVLRWVGVFAFGALLLIAAGSIVDRYRYWRAKLLANSVAPQKTQTTTNRINYYIGSGRTSYTQQGAKRKLIISILK